MVIEVTTFRLLTGVGREEFLLADKAAQAAFNVARGCIRRTTASSSDGEWLVAEMWWSEAEIDEYNARMVSNDVQLAFDELIDRSTIRSKRYADIGG